MGVVGNFSHVLCARLYVQPPQPSLSSYTYDSLYPIATGSGDQATELPDVVGDDNQEIRKANLVPPNTTTGEKGATDSEEREKPMVADSGSQQEEAGRAKEAQEAAVPEKLQNDDQWYKRWFFKLFPKLRKGVWGGGGCVNFCQHDMEFPIQLRSKGN